MVKHRNFSLYEIEEFLKCAGAEKVHEKAVVSFEMELEETVRELVNEAQFYANYAGRSNLITPSDILLAANCRRTSGPVPMPYQTRASRIRKRASASRKRALIEAKRI